MYSQINAQSFFGLGKMHSVSFILFFPNHIPSNLFVFEQSCSSKRIIEHTLNVRVTHDQIV